jgi:hypothetical protein
MKHFSWLLAERVGFEPTVARRATTVFETVPFNRSGTSPNSGAIITYIAQNDGTIMNISEMEHEFERYRRFFGWGKRCRIISK